MSLTGHNTKSSDSQPALGLPVAAPVLEYVCLFTHDLKRKQKRWQDGRLKFHTFNKRIMVYDERGNFIGDMHWREDFDFGEGEEFNLERGAVIVQVSECVGSKDQDLTDLLDKRAREAEQRYARSSAATANSPHLTVRPPIVPQTHPQASFRQRHLVDVVNTPRGPRGRAVIPTISPYEERIVTQQLLNSSEGESQRPIKRRRDISPPSKSGYAQNLFGATLNLSSWSASAPLRQQPTQTNRNASPTPETTAKPGVPSRNASSSLLRPSAILNLTGDDIVQVESFKPSAAASKRGGAGNATETPPNLNALVSTPFKAPDTGKLRSKAIQGEDQMLAESEETLVVRGQQPQSCANKTRNTAAKHSARKSQDAKLKSIRHHSAAQPSNDALHNSAIHPISAENESPEQRGGIAKDTDISALQPLTDESLLRLVRNTGPEEPKSKLRIKARKKRGLLMVAKNTTAKTSERQPDSPGTRIEAPVTERQLMAVDTLQIVGQAARSIPPVGILPRSVNCGVGGDACQCEPTRVYDDEKIQSWSDSAIEATFQLEPTLVNGDDIQSSGEPVHSRVKLREDKTQSITGPHREVEMMTTQSGPRLASLGRRSVKSKEVIGSLDPGKCRVAAENPPAAPASRKETIVCPKTDSERSSSAKIAETRLQEKATLLKNPATRGRKAAKKSDAAGSVPQPVLSGMPDLAVGRIDRRGGSRPEVTLDSAAALGGETAREVFGFSKASGGPWSKEAYDLLGCRRPRVKARVKGIGDGN
ncbi:uncharacterized protein LY79DRAFT_308209 [Colletotrichum navitas]|uniref:5'-3' DNA helicase ZGRF1-like N-terminal domain-containing protein n=1 Tax=Colletotrichum navitas TaxID=681940 RepID=A0AAD8PT53_9PEZI|nr:uncharacterized protein LY79DRAFT_308209 [Colletotrichum navitas]KAK1580278.1 hypothetical protein LY79DRAFT_308209 [Colletotrichum navitas]